MSVGIPSVGKYVAKTFAWTVPEVFRITVPLNSSTSISVFSNVSRSLINLVLLSSVKLPPMTGDPS